MPFTKLDVARSQPTLANAVSSEDFLVPVKPNRFLLMFFNALGDVVQLIVWLFSAFILQFRFDKLEKK